MKPLISRVVAFALVCSVLLPLLAGCGKSQKAMETPTGQSPKQIREEKKGTGQ
jgi:hypothetical protein